MGDYEHKEGGGSIFPNRKKTKESSPDGRGEIKIDGVTYEFAVWNKMGKGGPWQSIGGAKVKEDRPKQGNYPARKPDPQAPIGGWNPPDDDIPF